MAFEVGEEEVLRTMASFMYNVLVVRIQRRYVNTSKWLTLETSAFESLLGGQFTLLINVNKFPLSCCISHRRSTIVSLETYPLYFLL